MTSAPGRCVATQYDFPTLRGPHRKADFPCGSSSDSSLLFIFTIWVIYPDKLPLSSKFNFKRFFYFCGKNDIPYL
jgi:hypothetical protein